MGRSTCGSGKNADRPRTLSRPDESAARSDNGEDHWLVARSSLLSGPRSLSSNYLTLIILSWLSTNPTNALFRAKHREKARESNIGARARAPHRRQVVAAASSRL